MHPNCIAFYVTDHGFGHATRCIALIRALLARNDVEVLVRSGSCVPLLAASLAPWTARGRVRIVPGPTNRGWVSRPGSLEVDRERTVALAAAEVAGLPAWVERETEWCRRERVVLVVSDIVPGAFVVAGRLGVPALAVSNFTWFDAYAHLFPGAGWLPSLRRAYGQADGAAVLPFTSGVTALPNGWEAPLLGRRADAARARRIRARIKRPGEAVIYVGLGGSFPDLHRVAGRLFRGDAGLPASLIVGRGLGGVFPGSLEVPGDDPEGQDYLAAADAAVVKAGYSTVAEAVLARVPVVVLYRETIAEDRDIAAEVERLGVGVSIPVRDGRIRGDVTSALERALCLTYPSLPDRYRQEGDRLVAEWIEKHMALEPAMERTAQNSHWSDTE